MGAYHQRLLSEQMSRQEIWRDARIERGDIQQQGNTTITLALDGLIIRRMKAKLAQRKRGQEREEGSDRFEPTDRSYVINVCAITRPDRCSANFAVCFLVASFQ